MSEKPENLQLLVTKLQEEIRVLTNKRDNIQAQVDDNAKRLEAQGKLDKADYHQQRNADLKQFSAERAKVEADRNKLIHHETHLNKREADVARREAEVKDSKYWLDKMAAERAELYELRREAKEMMDKALVRLGEADSFEQSYNIKKREIEAGRNKIEDLEKKWNDKLGELESKEKSLARWERDLTAINASLDEKIKKEEVVNV